MRSAFEHYPEVILVDSTYKTNNLRMPLYFIISVDDQGQSEIVAVFLLTKPSFEYPCAVWDPYQQNNTHSLEMVQRMAAIFITKRHNNSPVSSMIQQLDC